MREPKAAKDDKRVFVLSREDVARLVWLRNVAYQMGFACRQGCAEGCQSYKKSHPHEPPLPPTVCTKGETWAAVQATTELMHQLEQRWGGEEDDNSPVDQTASELRHVAYEGWAAIFTRPAPDPPVEIRKGFGVGDVGVAQP